MSYSRRQLESFGEPLGESATRVKPGGQGRVYGSGGGGGPTSTTVTQSNLPDWLKPQVQGLLGAATRQFFTTELNPQTGQYDITGTRPFTPYSTNVKDYVAGFSPLQTQVQANAANLQVPGQFQQATDIARAAGTGATGTATQAAGYGQAGFQTGQDAAGAGNWYGQMVTDPTRFASYMSPYQQNVTDLQVEAAKRQADIARTQRGISAARAGAFGGSRQAIENAEAQKALASQIGNIEAQGRQNAYQQAMANINQQANIGLQGTGQALQGAQIGLQGVSGQQAGYGLGNQIANTLGGLGTQQLAAQTGILGLQNQIGAQQQQYQQQLINQAIQNYAQAQEAPYNVMSQFNALMRGYATPGQTTQQYQAQPALASQLAGLGGAGLSAYGLSQIGKKKGGAIKDTGVGIDELMHRKIMNKKVAA